MHICSLSSYLLKQLVFTNSLPNHIRESFAEIRIQVYSSFWYRNVPSNEYRLHIKPLHLSAYKSAYTLRSTVNVYQRCKHIGVNMFYEMPEGLVEIRYDTILYDENICSLEYGSFTQNEMVKWVCG